jgi:hypothetical protein
LSFAHRQYPGIAARLRELKGSKSDVDIGCKDFIMNKNAISRDLALS